jgi:hypothetical protein
MTTPSGRLSNELERGEKEKEKNGVEEEDQAKSLKELQIV